MYNILIGGAAGDGIETTAEVLEETLKYMGYYVFSMRDFMSRVRGGHNFNRIRFGKDPIYTHKEDLDGLIVMDEDSFHRHKDNLKERGFVISDPSLNIEHENLIHLDFKEMAKEAGNIRAGGSVIIGSLLSLFGLDINKARQVFKNYFPEKILEANLKSLDLGYNFVENQFDIEKTSDLSDHIMLKGSDAMSIGAIAANMRFYSAYPMSPATTLLNYFTKHQEELNLVVEQAEDEIAAMNMAIGASAAGVRAMTGSSGGGFALMVEALGMSGVAEIPLVIANVQRPGPATGLPTRTEQSDLRFVIHASQGEFPRMVISPQNHKELYHQTWRAFDLAEKYQIPVLVLSDQYLADSAAVLPMEDMLDHSPYTVEKLEEDVKVEVDEDGIYKRYQYTETGISPLYHYGSEYLVRLDSDEHTEYGVLTESADVRINMVDKRNKKIELLKSELIEPIFSGSENPDILIVGFGSTHEAIKEAVACLNEEVRDVEYAALSFGDIYPLPEKKLLKYGKKAKKIVSVEQNSEGQLAGLIRQESLLDCRPGFLKYDGRQMTAEEIKEALILVGKEVR